VVRGRRPPIRTAQLSCLQKLENELTKPAALGRLGAPGPALGTAEKNVQIEIAGGVLTIRGEKTAERSDQGKYFNDRT